MEMDDANQIQEQNPLRPGHNNRDPKEINKEVQVDFEDVIAEPDGMQSINGVWKASYFTFTGSKNCCYRFLTIMCGVPCSLMWGCSYACAAFNHIWCVMPCIRSSKLGCKWMTQCFSLGLENFFEPLFTPLGKICSNMNLVIRKDH